MKDKDKELKDKDKELKNKDEIITNLKIANERNKVINSKNKGENFEKEVASELNKSFNMITNDVISKITTGDKKADFLQEVKNGKKSLIGKIVYELKNAKWDNKWEEKLSKDIVNNDAKYGVLIVSKFHEKFGDLVFKQSSEYDNIWCSDASSFILLAKIIRKLIFKENELEEMKQEKLSNLNKSDKIKNIEKNIEKLKNFMDQDLKKFIIDYKKELKDIEAIAKALKNKSSKLYEINSNLNSNFENKIINKLNEMKIFDNIINF